MNSHPEKDEFDLDRFVTAQVPVYRQALAELHDGAKRSHWMWFIFPQMAGLGRSAMAQHYGIVSLDEARAYLRHPVLGPRLKECVETMLCHGNRTAHEILGSLDDFKFRSCLTLFIAADPTVPLFRQALYQFYGGETDPRTLDLLGLGDPG